MFQMTTAPLTGGTVEETGVNHSFLKMIHFLSESKVMKNINANLITVNKEIKKKKVEK